MGVPLRPDTVRRADRDISADQNRLSRICVPLHQIERDTAVRNADIDDGGRRDQHGVAGVGAADISVFPVRGIVPIVRGIRRIRGGIYPSSGAGNGGNAETNQCAYKRTFN